MTETTSPADLHNAHDLPAAEALRAFPEELRRLAVVSREVEETAGRLAGAAVDADNMTLQNLDMLTQYLEGMATFIECLLAQTDMADTVSRQSLIDKVKPYDLLQRLVEVSLALTPSTVSEVDLF
ncbi:MAG: hypothetical protein AAF225_03750 [Pseudomonadota bacterium]